MKFVDVEKAIRGVPFISPERGKDLYDLVLKIKPKRVLELGAAHGASASYMAAALEELNEGHLDAVDLDGLEWQTPPIEEVLQRPCLSHRVTVSREKSSYTWFLKKQIERNTSNGVCQPIYDLVFIDGPKNWTIDGAAFFMAEKLLRENGAIVFDDYNYAYGEERDRTDGVNHRTLGRDELIEPQIKAVFHLLVMQHPSFGRFEIINQQFAVGWKIKSDARTLVIKEQMGLCQKGLRAIRKARRAMLTRG
jgi:predicted O-methyltransferase YrrM